MKKKTVVLYIGIGCLLAVLTCLSYFDTRKQMLKVAERAFLEAVSKDLDKRWRASNEPVSYHYGKEKPKYVHLQIKKDDGTDESYSLEGMDFSQNVDSDVHGRMLHTITYQLRCFIDSDTLNSIWQGELLKSSIEARTAIIVGDNEDSMTFLCDSLSNEFNALPIYYAGAVNEIQLNAFIRFSLLEVFCWQNYTLILVLSFICWSVYTIWQFFTNRKSSCLVEGKFRLSKDVLYCHDLRCFMKGTDKISLPPKCNLIVKALMEAENNQLHGADLLAKVWDTNESNMNKLYIQNTKLRTVLKMLGDGFDILSMENNHFRLVFPYQSRML